MPLNTSDPEAVRDTARDILSRQEFASRRESWWDRIYHYITNPGDALADLLTWLDSQISVSGPTKAIAWLIALAALVAVVVFAIRFQRSTSQTGSVNVHRAPGVRGLSTADLLTQAEQCEARGEWRQAIRLRYSALIVALSQDGIVRLRDGKTTGEYLAEVRAGAPAAAEAFAGVTHTFESVWYGNDEATATQAGAVREMFDHTRQRVAS